MSQPLICLKSSEHEHKNGISKNGSINGINKKKSSVILSLIDDNNSKKCNRRRSSCNSLIIFHDNESLLTTIIKTSNEPSTKLKSYQYRQSIQPISKNTSNTSIKNETKK